jgi:hypothetical protein
MRRDKKPSYSSGVEKFLAEKVAPEILSTEGRIAILSVYFVMAIVSVWGCMNLNIDFKVTYFISEEAYVFQWFELDKEFF